MPIATKGGVASEKPTNRIAKAVKHKVAFLGVPIMAFLFYLVFATVLFNFISGIAGVAFLLAACIGTLLVLKFEVHPIRAFYLWWSYGRHRYDAGSRSFFHQTQEFHGWSLSLNLQRLSSKAAAWKNFFQQKVF